MSEAQAAAWDKLRPVWIPTEMPNGVPIVYAVDDKLNATRTHWLG